MGLQPVQKIRQDGGRGLGILLFDHGGGQAQMGVGAQGFKGLPSGIAAVRNQKIMKQRRPARIAGRQPFKAGFGGGDHLGAQGADQQGRAFQQRRTRIRTVQRDGGDRSGRGHRGLAGPRGPAARGAP